MLISFHKNGINFNSDMDLDSMKYAELRGIAKGLGLKANMKYDKLLKAIKQYYQQMEDKKEAHDKDDVFQEGNIIPEDEEAASQENVFSPSVFVNTRRIKGTKRKIPDPVAVTDCDANSPPNAAEGEVAAAKKRNVSCVEDFDKSEAVQDITDEATALGEEGKATKLTKGSKIPHHQGRVQQKNKLLLKPVTPNFKILHAAYFDKMESIDTYVQRKTKQMKKASEKTELQQAGRKTQARGTQSGISLFSPVMVNKRPAEDRRTQLSAKKAPDQPTVKEGAPFRPSVLSTRRINVQFSKATLNEVKTRARRSICATSSTTQEQTADGGKSKNVKTSTFSATKSPGAFVFTRNTNTSTTPRTQMKNTFDLKGSLSRPLTYKPHTGKLKLFGDAKENTSAKKSLISNLHQRNYKQHQVKTRDDRRAKQTEDRKQKKENLLGARRGLVMM